VEVFELVSPVLELREIQGSGEPETFWSADLVKGFAFTLEKETGVFIAGEGEEEVESSHGFFQEVPGKRTTISLVGGTRGFHGSNYLPALPMVIE
jgi:hypothetical protein